MPPEPILQSVQNPQIKQAALLRERRTRDETDCFLIEGYRELSRASESGLALTTLFICRELFLGSNESALISKIERSGARVIECKEAPFRKLSYRDRPDGLIAIAPQFHTPLSSLRARGASTPLFLLAEAIEKPGNLGTILRSSDATAVSGLILCDRCTDLFNPNVVRASVGTLFTVPVAEASSEEALAWIRERGLSLLAATPHAKALYTEVDLSVPLIIAIGTEQLGLSERLLGAADIKVRIPMLGSADSLNVAMATTVLLYEALRQRGLS